MRLFPHRWFCIHSEVSSLLAAFNVTLIARDQRWGCFHCKRWVLFAFIMLSGLLCCDAKLIRPHRFFQFVMPREENSDFTFSIYIFLMSASVTLDMQLGYSPAVMLSEWFSSVKNYCKFLIGKSFELVMKILSQPTCWSTEQILNFHVILCWQLQQSTVTHWQSVHKTRNIFKVCLIV